MRVQFCPGTIVLLITLSTYSLYSRLIFLLMMPRRSLHYYVAMAMAKKIMRLFLSSCADM